MYLSVATIAALLPFYLQLAAAVPSGSINERATSCTVTAAASVSAAKAACTTITIGTLEVPAGETLDLTDLTTGTHVIFTGNVSFGYKAWSGPLVSISGTDITVTGKSGSVLDGVGSRWWDGKGSNGGVTKPKFFQINSLKSSTITGITLKDTPVQAFSIYDCTSVNLTSITVNNKNGDTSSLGHNTDAFDVGGSTNIFIDKPTVYNQDDCLAINSGTNIHFTNGYCSGGHGISIGSVGGRSDNVVDTVVVSGCQVVDSQNGVRIKTIYNATGSVTGVTYSDITLSGITKYGIVIEQDYENGSPTGTPSNGVPITDLTINGVTGTVNSTCTEVYILCGSDSCSDWTWENVDISGGKLSTSCKNVPSFASC